jgi:hypothetical protein
MQPSSLFVKISYAQGASAGGTRRVTRLPDAAPKPR